MSIIIIAKKLSEPYGNSMKQRVISYLRPIYVCEKTKLPTWNYKYEKDWNIFQKILMKTIDIYSSASYSNRNKTKLCHGIWKVNI